MDLGWVKSMPGDFGEYKVNIVFFLAFGTIFVTLRDTSSYSIVADAVSFGLSNWRRLQNGTVQNFPPFTDMIFWEGTKSVWKIYD